jgi:hypothetical protein
LFVRLRAKLGIREEVVAEVAEEGQRAVDEAGALKLNGAGTTTLREHYAPPETQFLLDVVHDTYLGRLQA